MQVTMLHIYFSSNLIFFIWIEFIGLNLILASFLSIFEPFHTELFSSFSIRSLCQQLRLVDKSNETEQFSFHLQTRVNCLKRSPTPKLGDLLPKVPGKWWLNSQRVGPETDWNLEPFEKEYFALDGEKLTLSWVNERHLCFELWVVLILLQTEP